MDVLSHFWNILRISHSWNILQMRANSGGSAHMSQADWMHFGYQRCDNKGVWVHLVSVGVDQNISTSRSEFEMNAKTHFQMPGEVGKKWRRVSCNGWVEGGMAPF